MKKENKAWLKKRPKNIEYTGYYYKSMLYVAHQSAIIAS